MHKVLKLRIYLETTSISANLNIYRLQTKLREGNLFTPACDSVHWVRGSPSRRAPSWVDTSLGRHTRGQNPLPPADTPLGRNNRPHPKQTPTTTEAGGTHPTGMHSSLVKVYLY